MVKAANSNFRAIPAVNDVLSQPEVASLVEKYSHDAMVELVREVLSDARSKVMDGSEPPSTGRRRPLRVRAGGTQPGDAGPAGR